MNDFRKYPKLLTIDKSALLIIDIQERIYKVVQDHEDLVSNALKLIKAANLMKIPIFHTEQYTKGLGPTVSQIRNELKDQAIHKLTFSCFNAEDLFERLGNSKVEQVIISGIEAHVCVQQTVLDLLSSGFQVNLAVDAISSRKRIDCNTAIKRMENEGAITTTVESILFELLQICDTPLFKEISRLIK